MNTMAQLKTFALTLAFGLYGCGDDSGEGGSAGTAVNPKGKIPTSGSQASGSTSSQSSMFVLARASLPRCTSANDAVVYFVSDEDVLTICLNGVYVDVNRSDGSDGADGSKGDKGSKGDQGSQGDKGEVGKTGANIFDDNDDSIGTLATVDTTEFVVFPDGGMAHINFYTGEFVNSVAINSSNGSFESGSDIICYFESADCSGTCFMVKAFSTTTVPVKNSVFATPTGAVIATGDEVVDNDVDIQSSYTNGSCSSTVAADQTGYPIAQSYTLPNSTTLPFSGPLYIGVETD